MAKKSYLRKKLSEITLDFIDFNCSGFIVHPGLDTDKVRHKAWDGTLEDGVIAQNDVLIVNLNQIILQNH